MNTSEQKKLAKKLIAVLGKEDAIELLKYLQDHPTDKKHKVSDLLAILETSSEKQIQDYLNSGIECLMVLLGFKECSQKGNIRFKVFLSSNYSERCPQFDVIIVVPAQTVVVAELVLDKIREQLRRIFRADSCPVKNALLGKVSVQQMPED
mgnify:FL=1